jgi:hypothetical protein
VTLSLPNRPFPELLLQDLSWMMDMSLAHSFILELLRIPGSRIPQIPHTNTFLRLLGDYQVPTISGEFHFESSGDYES